MDANSHDCFNFQRSLNIKAINKETKALDRKAHLFWEIPAIDAQVNTFMYSISISGDAKHKLIMTGDTKDARTYFSEKETRVRAKYQTGTKLCRFHIYDV